ncbi:MAG: family 16 glycoside hydrolase [Planctomycetota bacterium]
MYQVEGDLEHIPKLALNQTPNFDQVFGTLNFEGQAPWANVFDGPRLIAIDAQLSVPEPGIYALRLRGDGALSLRVGNRKLGETTLNDPGEVHNGFDFKNRAFRPLHIRQFTPGQASSLTLEWRRKGPTEFEPVPAAYFRSPADPTRVTSPGVKRLANTRSPGDGNPVAGVHPSYDVVTIRPTDSKPSVGSMAFLNDGRLVVGTFSPIQRSSVALPDIDSKTPDQLYEVRGAAGDDPSAYELVPIADGLLEPSGLCAIGDDLYVAHRRAVTRLTDEDGDGYLETHHNVASGWEGWNYHQFTFGLIHRQGKLYVALSTAMAPPAWEGMRANSAPNGPMRGALLEIDPAADSARVIAGGLRTPNTVALGPDDELFYADNQGTWFPTSVLSHLQPGRFYGHYNNTNVVPELAERYPEGGHPSTFGEQLRSRPVVYLPQNEMINSPSKAIMIHEGPFAGQMLLGEITSGGIRRVQVEKVNGQWQGVVFRFTQGLESGVNRLAWGPDGHLYVGGIGASGNWSWNDTRFGLQRMMFNGKPTFEIYTVNATPDGFHIRFTQPIDPAWLADARNYTVEQWGYSPSQRYGGEKANHENLSAQHAQPDADGQGVRLTIPGLKADRCVYLRMNPTSIDGQTMWATEAYYTLNMIPSAEPLAHSTLAGQPFVSPDHQPGVGVGVLPTDDGVALIGRSHQSHMFFATAEQTKMPRNGAVTQTELIAMTPERGIAVAPQTGDLKTAAVFGDHRLHVEWLAPGRAPGSDGGPYTTQTGNSGVYLQDRYEIQVLGTPDHTVAQTLEPWEAGSIYNNKPADHNASAGPGQWQSYDIWFRAARFNAQGDKTEDARITVYWNGQLVHHDVAIQAPTGQAAKHYPETVGPGETILTGPLRLQAHFSDADGPVRFRNVWVAPLEASSSAPQAPPALGPFVDLFDGQSLDGWVIRGGRAEFSVEDQQIVGTAVPDSGGNTFLVTEKTYGDFELTYDIHTTALNSGVQIRSRVDGGIDNHDGRLRGYQVEADPSERRYSGGIFDEGRRGWLTPLIEKPYARRAWRRGEWNTVTVVARGPIIQTWINGVPAARLHDAMTASGHIALQVHGVGERTDRPEVRFKNIRLRELTPTTPPSSP